MANTQRMPEREPSLPFDPEELMANYIHNPDGSLSSAQTFKLRADDNREHVAIRVGRPTIGEKVVDEESHELSVSLGSTKTIIESVTDSVANVYKVTGNTQGTGFFKTRVLDVESWHLERQSPGWVITARDTSRFKEDLLVDLLQVEWVKVVEQGARIPVEDSVAQVIAAMDDRQSAEFRAPGEMLAVVDRFKRSQDI